MRSARCLAPLLGILALSIFASGTPARAEGATGPAGTDRRPLSETAGPHSGRPMIALLQRLDRQIAEDHLAIPQNDNASQTLETIIGMLERAPAEDVQLLIDLPSHFAKRADEAAESGRDAEAKRFLLLAEVLSGTAPADAAAGTVPQSPQTPASGNNPLAVAEPSQAVSAPAREAATRAHGERTGVSQPSGANPVSNSATGDPPEIAATLPDTQGVLGRYSSSKDRRPDPLVASSQLPTVFVTLPALRKVVAIPQPRGMAPPTRRVPVKGTVMDSRCRDIAQEFAIGEVPTEAERGYLRKGCQGG